MCNIAAKTQFVLISLIGFYLIIGYHLVHKCGLSSVYLFNLECNSFLLQLMTVLKENPKQTASLVSGVILKENKRLEAANGRTTEKSIKANLDAMWARFQEESVKNEKMIKDNFSQMTNLITNHTNKDMPLMIEKVVKKELATLARGLEKSVSSSVTEAFQVCFIFCIFYFAYVLPAQNKVARRRDSSLIFELIKKYHTLFLIFQDFIVLIRNYAETRE